MEGIEDVITKLKSSLPMCRVCLDTSMEYIEFETSLCVINGQEITYYEGFHELTRDFKDFPQHNLLTNFCATCGNDLLNAYLFMKRVESSNYMLEKVLAKESLKQQEANEGMVYSSDFESHDSKEEIKVEGYSELSEEKIDFNILVENTDDFKEANDEYDELRLIGESLENDLQNTIAEETQTMKSEDTKDHDNNSNDETTFWACRECGFQFESEESLDEHKHRSHKDILTKCMDCGKLLLNEEIENHMLFFEHLKLEEFEEANEPKENKEHIKCTICSDTFQTQNSLTLHKYRVHDKRETNGLKKKDYKKCKYCSKFVLTKSFLEKHSESQSDNEEYICIPCEEIYPTKLGGAKQNAHSQTQHRKRYACHICGKLCLRPFSLKKHIQHKHMSEGRKHQCEDCGLCFAFPYYLREHRRKHNVNSRFKCLHCDRTFLRKPQLNIHMRYHLNEFPYKCDQCDKAYATKSNLIDHITSRHTQFTFDCDKCDHKFKSQTGLRKHKYTHDGYPYNCPMCTVGATSRSGMKQHMMGVHKDAITEEEFDTMFPVINPKTGYRRPKDCQDKINK